MLAKLKAKNRKLLRILLSTLGFSTALFVFQACYGTKKDFGIDVAIKGCVKSKHNDKPLSGIKVSVENYPQYTYTDNNGNFVLYGSHNQQYKLNFTDNSQANSSLLTTIDTVVSVKRNAPTLAIFMNK